MFSIIGMIVVLACVGGGYTLGGGHLGVIWQPGEFLIIAGAAFGAFIISNGSGAVGVLKSIPVIFRGAKYHRKDFLQLLCCLYVFFRLAKTKGDMALEAHVEKPEESSVFQQFPTIIKDHEAMDFLCGYMRLLTLGTNNSNEVEAIMDAEIEGNDHEKAAKSAAVLSMADGMPALGIVAAVLGVIHTMGLISEPPEKLGVAIGAALVGTFLGVLLSYGFVGPIGNAMQTAYASESEYLKVMKAALIGHMQGYAPQISVEFARKTLPPHQRPSFSEVDIACSGLTIPTA